VGKQAGFWMQWWEQRSNRAGEDDLLLEIDALTASFLVV
jgi:hypothetical protein